MKKWSPLDFLTDSADLGGSGRRSCSLQPRACAIGRCPDPIDSRMPGGERTAAGVRQLGSAQDGARSEGSGGRRVRASPYPSRSLFPCTDSALMQNLCTVVAILVDGTGDSAPAWPSWRLDVGQILRQPAISGRIVGTDAKIATTGEKVESTRLSHR